MTTDSQFLEQYEILEIIQSEGAGYVQIFRARHRKNGMLCIVKGINKIKLRAKSQTIKNLQSSELEILGQIDHPNLHKVSLILDGQCYTYIIFENMNNKSIKEFLKQMGGMSEL